MADDGHNTITGARLAQATGVSLDAIRTWRTRGLIPQAGRNWTFDEAVRTIVMAKMATRSAPLKRAAELACDIHKMIRPSIALSRTSDCVVAVLRHVDGGDAIWGTDSNSTGGAWGSLMRTIEDERMRRGIDTLLVVDLRHDLRRVIALFGAAEAETQEETHDR